MVVAAAGVVAAEACRVTGPYNAIGSPIDTANRRRIFICHPNSDADETACASKIFANIAHRAFRRPVTDKDVAPPLAFFKDARTTGNFEVGIQSGLIAILASPKFLYRAEPAPANLKPGSVYHVSDLDLASRLSFFLWSTIPDDELLGLAEQGKLKDPKVFEQQVRRMLADPKAEALVSNFAVRNGCACAKSGQAGSGRHHFPELQRRAAHGLQAAKWKCG